MGSDILGNTPSHVLNGNSMRITMNHTFLKVASRAVLAATCLVGIVVGPVHGQVGGAAVLFLQIEPDSRSAGMGNTGVATADNANTVFWNPAGLALQRGTEASLTHSTWLPEFNAGLFYEYVSFKHQLEPIGTLGAHLTYLFLGEHEARDESNIPTGEFRSYDMAGGVSYGTNVTDRFAVGTGIRLVYSNLASGQRVGAQETKAGVTIGFDLAGLYRAPRFQLGGTEVGVNFGFNLANMGPKIQYSDEGQSDPIPQNLRMGYAVTFEFDQYNKLTLAQDFNKVLIHSEKVTEDDDTGEVVEVHRADPFYKALLSGWQAIEVRTSAADAQEQTMERLNAFQQMTIGSGFEYWYRDLFAIRTGFFYENPYFGNRKFLTFGSGIRWNILGIDFSYIYALEEDHPLSDTMRFSLLLNFLR